MPAEKVILQFCKMQGEYIKTFPLHDSQRIIAETGNTVTFEMYICLTHDFIMELMRYDANVQVIEPQSLINDIKTRIEDVRKLYT